MSSKFRDGGLYKTWRRATELYPVSASKDGIFRREFQLGTHWCSGGEIIMKLTFEHEYANNWTVVLYGDKLWFMNMNYLESCEVRDEE